VVFQPGGEQLATGCEDWALRVINTMTGLVIRKVDHGGPVRGAGRFASEID